MKNFTITQKITAAALITIFAAAIIAAKIGAAGFTLTQLLN